MHDSIRLYKQDGEGVPQKNRELIVTKKYRSEIQSLKESDHQYQRGQDQPMRNEQVKVKSTERTESRSIAWVTGIYHGVTRRQVERGMGM